MELILTVLYVHIGLPEKELDTVKELIFGTNLYLMLLTFVVSFFHVRDVMYFVHVPAVDYIM